ncbi:MAG: M23 family metallopeptidase, partial [Flavobacteriaceae bacterium]|nr:M23 family metallopeptidase [Flavobacteriaceae bacterium]
YLYEKGKTHKGTGTKNEDFYAFGKPIIAPCDGEVVLAVDGVKDNIPGELNPTFITGNTVIIKTINNEYLLFAHFKLNTVAVILGQKVKTGDFLGSCGNSGNSSEAHLHFHIQNVEDFNKAVGAKCYFDNIIVNGEVKTDYMPVKNDKVKNVN